MEKLGLVFFPAFDWAISSSHPEREERLLYTRDQIVEEGLLDVPGIREYKPSVATLEDLCRVHVGIPDVASHITDAHRVSAGGAIAAADAVMAREVKRSFALVRPPGHHAMRFVHGTRGFCTVNIEAVMVEYLRAKYGIRKVAIVDTDVHHGDGTQDIFYHDPDVLFISLHQDGRTLYPGSGFPEEWGSPNALGKTVNIPLPPGTGDEGIHKVLDELILPFINDFGAELVINSAGQDNHYSDPLANMAVTARGYARLAEKLAADIAVLEGGYSIESALPYVNTGIILAMAGLDYSGVIEPDRRQPVQTEQVNRQIESVVKNWRDIWRQRDILRREAVKKAGDYWERNRRIYYDDSGIDEYQKEKVRLCNRCSGYLLTETEAYGAYQDGRKGAAAVIFRDTCPNCRREALDWISNLHRREKGVFCYIQDQAAGSLEKL